jgi:radical SAM superfamily enzyme YgiQ (UPF0313 family)
MTTGIVYLPIGLAYFADGLTKLDLEFEVLDLFGLNPKIVAEHDGNWFFGEEFRAASKKLLKTPDQIVLYANQAANHLDILNILSEARELYPESDLYLLENSQAVTAYALKDLEGEFSKLGVRGIITGNPDRQVANFWKLISGSDCAIKNPSPDWSKLPLDNYWLYKLGHGPITSSRYLPVLTSYGCPWGCSFCVIPATNSRKWVTRKADDIVSEIRNGIDRYSVKEFHFEDLNSTVSSSRILELGLLLKGLGITWKIVAGTKAETLDSFDTLRLLHDSGLTYFSFSPESGSSSVRQEIGKKFNIWHSFKLIRWSRHVGVKTQACFVIGMPSEKFLDRVKSLTLIRAYTILGIDEIAIFVISPMPGSKLYKRFEVDLKRISFSPKWRRDYNRLSLVRLYWYFNFLLLKSLFHPIKFIESIMRFFMRDFELKMEMAPFRSIQWKNWVRNSDI